MTDRQEKILIKLASAYVWVGEDRFFIRCLWRSYSADKNMDLAPWEGTHITFLRKRYLPTQAEKRAKKRTQKKKFVDNFHIAT
jgi:hypothetical protein